MKSLFEPAGFADIVRRVEALQADSPRQWGKMTPAQMLEHAARALEMALAQPSRPQALLGKLISWMVRKSFVGPKPFGKNGPTAPDFVIKDQPDFARTKERLQSLLRDFHAQGEQPFERRVHVFFGPLSGAEWGVTQYKHLDHHLRQFGLS